MRLTDPLALNVETGRVSGHLPAPCFVCGERSMTAARPWTANRKPRDVDSWPRCRFRPTCPGRHIPVDHLAHLSPSDVEADRLEQAEAIERTALRRAEARLAYMSAPGSSDHLDEQPLDTEVTQ